jgi:DNA-binding transcriptional ArsR family regulator
MLNQSPALDNLFHALADPTRRAMVERLTMGSASVSELARPLSMTLPSVVQHLQVLESSGLIVTEKAGRVRTCRMAPTALAEAERWIVDRRRTWESRLDRLEAYLGEIHGPNPEQGDAT